MLVEAYTYKIDKTKIKLYVEVTNKALHIIIT